MLVRPDEGVFLRIPRGPSWKKGAAGPRGWAVLGVDPASQLDLAGTRDQEKAECRVEIVCTVHQVNTSQTLNTPHRFFSHHSGPFFFVFAWPSRYLAQLYFTTLELQTSWETDPPSGGGWNPPAGSVPLWFKKPPRPDGEVSTRACRNRRVISGHDSLHGPSSLILRSIPDSLVGALGPTCTFFAAFLPQ